MTPFPVRGMLHNPMFLTLGAISLLVVLTVLYRGFWRHITDAILNIVNAALSVVMLFTVGVAMKEFLLSTSGTPGRRSVHLTWGLILTASFVFTGIYCGLLNDDSNPVGRFLKKFRQPIDD